MAHMKKLPISMTDREKRLGFGYLLLDLFILPALLSAMNQRLAVPLSGAWTNFLYFSLNFLFLAVIFSRFLKRSLMFAGQHIWEFFLAVIPGFLLYWLSNVLLSAGILWLYPGFSNINDGSIAQMTEGNFVIVAIGTVLLVPMAEELLHRGLVFGSLHRKSRAAAYMISMLFFAAIHVLGYLGFHDSMSLFLSFVQYLPAGLILAWAYEKSGCIFAPIAIHTVINAMGIYALR